jgi:hypothetical protein
MRSPTTWYRRALVSVGSATLVLALGPLDTAGSSPAATAQQGDPPTLTASLVPTAVAPNGRLVYSSVDPCPTVDENVRLFFSYWTEGALDSGQEDALPLHDGYVEIAEDGAWTAVMPAPEEVGRYEIIASCLTDDQDPSDPVPGDPAVVHAEYSPIDFEVVPGSPAPDSPTAPPARPVPAEPNFTG